MLILNKYVRRFIDVPLLFICFFCRGRTMSWKKFCAIWREQLEVHNSLSVEMKSATLGCGQLSLVAGRGLRRHLCKCQAFVCTWGGFTWLLVTLPPPPPMSPTLSSFHLYSPPSSLSLHSSRHWADRHSSSAGTLAQVDQVSHLPGDCAACAFLWLSAAQLEVFSAPLVCCHVR